MLGTDPGPRPLSLPAVVMQVSAISLRLSVAEVSSLVSLVIEPGSHLIPLIRILITALQVEVSDTARRRIVLQVKASLSPVSLSLSMLSAAPLLLQVTQSLTHKPNPQVLVPLLHPKPGLVLQVLPQDDLLA